MKIFPISPTPNFSKIILSYLKTSILCKKIAKNPISRISVYKICISYYFTMGPNYLTSKGISILKLGMGDKESILTFTYHHIFKYFI